MQRSHSLLPGWAVPSIVLRGILLAVMLAAVMMLVTPAVWFWVGIAAAVAAACMPRSLTAWGVILCIVIGVMLETSSPGHTAIALVAVTLIHQLAALTLILPLRGYIQLPALVPTLQRFVVVQLVVQPLAFLLLLGWSGQSSGGTASAAPLGAALLLLGVTAFVVLSRRGTKPTRS